MDVVAANPYQKVVQANQSEQLILDHLYYVRHVLGRTVADVPEGVDLENLEAAGILGLVEAAAQFDPRREVAFTTFAYMRIRGAILDELRRNCPLSRKMLKHWDLIRTAYGRLEPPVAPEDLAEATGLQLEEVFNCLQSIRLTNPDSWHEELDRRELSPDAGGPPAETAERDEELQLLADSIEQLPDQERTVLTLYHLEELRLKEIGDVLNLSESRISRVLASAELRLKETVRRRVDRTRHSLQDRRIHTHDSHTTDRSGVPGEPHTAPRRSQVPGGSDSGRRTGS
ncbi:MAG: sigma-70 family RNA polymerase sigma factor [Planctomycetaceae bacterium]